MAIHIENLSKNYGSKTVLQGINLHLEAGRVYGIAGENGAGKTTFFRCLVGLEDYTGTIRSDFADLKNHIGYLETNSFFLSRITGREYLKLLSIARGITKDDFDQRNIFDLPLDEFAENYSTGMKKKLALLGILFQKNKVFILDEPFNGVDIQSNILITEIIARLRHLGKTVLISSHIFSTLRDTCDEIHLLRGGIFAKKVESAGFNDLEDDMKSAALGDKIGRLEL